MKLWNNRIPLVAVVRENNYELALKNIKAIIIGGIEVIEITLTTPKAIELIKKFSNNPNLFIGAGSVCNINDALEAKKAGAKFIVSPHFDFDFFSKLYKNSYGHKKYESLIYIPGISTPSEAYKAWNQINTFTCFSPLLKLFPASVLGVEFVYALKKPYPFLKLMPSGGVSFANLEAWILSGVSVLSVGNSLTTNLDFEHIIINVQKYVKKVKAFLA